jgi:hypothetical protein
MPCRSDYMDASKFEIQMSQVACLLDESTSGVPVNTQLGSWRGYHPIVYNQNLSKQKCDKMVEQLCNFCQTADVSKYSLELQIWWRDHQKADKERLEAEIRDAERNKQRDKALAKLTDYEKKLLGLK